MSKFYKMNGSKYAINHAKSELYLLNSILYKNSHLFMSRKKNKFDHYVNTEILHKTDGDCNA